MERVGTSDASISGLEQALAKKDWDGMREQAELASNAMNRLSAGPALTSLTKWNEPPTLEELREDLKQAREDLAAAQQAIREKNAAQLESAMQKFRKSIGPVQEAAKKQSKQ